jgi:hypothetical protein
MTTNPLSIPMPLRIGGLAIILIILCVLAVGAIRMAKR